MEEDEDEEVKRPVDVPRVDDGNSDDDNDGFLGFDAQKEGLGRGRRGRVGGNVGGEEGGGDDVHATTPAQKKTKRGTDFQGLT